MLARSRHAREAWTREQFLCPTVVKPPPPWLEARDDRMTCLGIMFRGVLIGRAVAAADMIAFGTSPQVKPSATAGQAIHATRTARLSRKIKD